MKFSTLSIAVIAFVLAAAACANTSERDSDNDWADTAIANLSVAYSGAQGVWTGFDPNDHPAVIAYRSDSGEVESLLAINYPTPGALGDATALNVGDAPFRSLSRVANVEPDIAAMLEEIPHFELSADLRGSAVS